MNLKTITQQLQARFENPQQVALWILEKITGKNSGQLLLQKLDLTEIQEQELTKALDLLVNQQYPLQYYLGTVPFGPLELLIEPPILIPRPETEAWVADLIDQLESFKNTNLTILDLCSGSGCIGLWIAYQFPHFTVHGVDINPQAIKLAHKNKELLNLQNIIFFQSDLFTGLPNQQKYDLIIANPPYITHTEYQALEPHVKKWESKIALTADNNGLYCYEQIIKQAPHYLKQQKKNNLPNLIFEIGHQQGYAVTQLLTLNGYKNYEIKKDCAHKDRVVTAYYLF